MRKKIVLCFLILNIVNSSLLFIYNKKVEGYNTFFTITVSIDDDNAIIGGEFFNLIKQQLARICINLEIEIHNF